MAEARHEPSAQLPSYGSSPEAARGVVVSALSASNAAESLKELDTNGFLSLWLPELERLKGVEQPKEHYWDVYEHSLQTVAATEVVIFEVLPQWRETNLHAYLLQNVNEECSRLVLLKLAALFHDIAKPQTKSFEPNGRMRFFGHAEVGAQVAQDAMIRLGFSEKAREMTGLMIEHHLRPGQLTGRPELPTERALYRFFRDTASVGIETLLLNMADHKAMKGPMLAEHDWQQHINRTREIVENHLAKQQAVKPAKLVDGHEMMARFGLEPGPLVGDLLSMVREAQARGEITSKVQALSLVSHELRKNSKRLAGR